MADTTATGDQAARRAAMVTADNKLAVLSHRVALSRMVLGQPHHQHMEAATAADSRVKAATRISGPTLTSTRGALASWA